MTLDKSIQRTIKDMLRTNDGLTIKAMNLISEIPPATLNYHVKILEGAREIMRVPSTQKAYVYALVNKAGDSNVDLFVPGLGFTPDNKIMKMTPAVGAWSGVTMAGIIQMLVQIYMSVDESGRENLYDTDFPRGTRMILQEMLDSHQNQINLIKAILEEDMYFDRSIRERYLIPKLSRGELIEVYQRAQKLIDAYTENAKALLDTIPKLVAPVPKATDEFLEGLIEDPYEDK